MDKNDLKAHLVKQLHPLYISDILYQYYNIIALRLTRMFSLIML